MSESEWCLAHRDLLRIGRARAALEHALGCALLRAFRAEVWRPLGVATFLEYAERYVGLSARQTEERLRVVSALGELPQMTAALSEGRAHFTAVRELSRIAVPATESEWLIAAEGKSVAEIEELVSGRRPGDRPGDPPHTEARRHRIVLDVPADVYATYREAQAKLRRDSDAALSEADGLLLMARTVLRGPDDERSSYQIAVTVCPSCNQASHDGRGAPIPVDVAAAETAQCDAQRVDASGKARQDIPPAVRRLVVRRQHGRCAVPGCRLATFIDVHHLKPRADGGTHDPDNLCVLCAAHHGALHRGALRIDGTWSQGLTFRHADGTPYGAPPELFDDVRAALRGLGFKERESRFMVDEVRPHVGAESSVASVIRLALQAQPCAGPA